MKKIILAIIGVVIIGGAVLFFRRGKNDRQYLTEAVVRGSLTQTVSASGKVKATSDILLSFEQQGQVASIAVEEGARVAKDTALATLNQRDANSQVANATAAVAAAQAEYDTLIAGATTADKRVAAVNFENAEEGLAQTRARAAADNAKAEQALAEARITLTAAQTNLTRDIDSYLATAITGANNAEKKTQGVLNTINEIYTTNGNFESFLTINNVATQANAENAFEAVDAAWQSFTSTLASFRITPTELAVASFFSLLESSLVPLRNIVNATSMALVDASVSSSAPKTITTYRSDIASAWGDVNASIADLADARVDLVNARANGEATVAMKQAAVATAEQNLNNVRAQTEQSIALAEGELKRAQANFDKVVAPPTAEERALRRARVDEAQASLLTAQTALARTTLKAPIDGVVTKVSVEAGETVTPGETVIRLFAVNAFEVSVQVPEADIPKVSKDDPAVITLDAYGDGQEFSGMVHFINPAETLIDDVVYYDITILFDEEGAGGPSRPGGVKPGMSADVTITTDGRNNAHSLPLRAIKEKDGAYYVEVLKDGQTQERGVTLGLRADGGRVEILEGIEEGELVVVGIKKK